VLLANSLSFKHLQVVLENGEAHSVVGSLDLNQGLQLPGELSGNHPKDGEAEQKRGYLSNVCVAPQVRKRGIGVALLQRAQEVAQLWGIFLCLSTRLLNSQFHLKKLEVFQHIPRI
jgi:ribosomal protein S18 acetylase RimI-like enzyme